MQPSVIVVGGGISGHTAGWRLHRHGVAVTVLDASEKTIGGEMSSVVIDGFVCNRASTLIPSSYTQITGLMGELGLGSMLHGAIPAVTSIPRDGRMHRMRVSGGAAAIDGLTTGLLSPSAKLKLFSLGMDVARKGRKIEYGSIAADLDDETIGQYARRRLNPELYEYMIGALIRAAYLSEPDDLSVLDLLFAVSKFAGDTFTCYEGGIGMLNEAIAAKLGTRMGAHVVEVEEYSGGVRVRWEEGGAEHVREADACVVAVPAPQAARICPHIDARQRDILASGIPYCSIIKASHALRSRSDDPTTMMSFPRQESAALGVITFDHNYRRNCAPDGHGLIASYWMHDWSVPRLDPAVVEDAALECEMIPEIERFIPNFAADLIFSDIQRWPQATPVSYAGMWRRVKSFVDAVSPNARIQFAGDYLNIPGTKAASLSGETAASRLIARLGCTSERG